MVMKTVAAGDFKARCLSLMDDMQRTRETVIITKRGKPVAKLVPVPAAKDNFIGRLKGRIRIVGDIESPVVPPETWKYS
jgi:prevent-host-death family protein